MLTQRKYDILAERVFLNKTDNSLSETLLKFLDSEKNQFNLNHAEEIRLPKNSTQLSNYYNETIKFDSC